MPRRWYLVHARTGKETLAALNLRRQAYEAFLPTSFRTIRHARQIRTGRTAYFPGYLFVALDTDHDRWRAIDGTIGVIRLVKAREQPLPTPSGLVEALIAATGADGALDLAGSLQPGAPARLIQGPFADQLVRVESMSAPERVRVLLDIMNQQVPLEVRRSALCAV